MKKSALLCVASCIGLLLTTSLAHAGTVLQARTDLTTVHRDLESNRPKIEASLKALDANRRAALVDFRKDGRLLKPIDAFLAALGGAPQNATTSALLTRTKSLREQTVAFERLAAAQLSKWNTSFSTYSPSLVTKQHLRFSEATSRLAATPASIGEIETITREMQSSLAAADSVVTTATTLARELGSAWGRVNELRVQLESEAGNFGDTPGITDAGGNLVEEMAAMNMEFLAMQNAAQNESRSFETVSNASEARHDLALRAIQGIE